MITDPAWIIVLDVVRILVALACLLIGAYQVALIRATPEPGQRARFAGVLVAMVIIGGSRITNLGAPVTWQLLASVLLVALLGYGSWRFRYERPATRR